VIKVIRVIIKVTPPRPHCVGVGVQCNNFKYTFLLVSYLIFLLEFFCDRAGVLADLHLLPQHLDVQFCSFRVLGNRVPVSGLGFFDMCQGSGFLQMIIMSKDSKLRTSTQHCTQMSSMSQIITQAADLSFQWHL
jgi:hypothetical protein